jgi:hypothetical protein
MAHAGLSRDWLVSSSIDLELKQYVLLGYLQRVHARFKENKLYPHLEELASHLRDLTDLLRARRSIVDRYPGQLVGFDVRTGQLHREPPQEDEVLSTVNAVIEFAMPYLHRTLDQGLGLRDELASHIRFGPIGVLPLRLQEGWLLLRTGREARAYAYTLPPLHRTGSSSTGAMLQTRYVSTFTLGITRTYEDVRRSLIEQFREWPVPATYAFESDVELPPIETFMPLAKQLVVDSIATRDTLSA